MKKDHVIRNLEKAKRYYSYDYEYEFELDPINEDDENEEIYFVGLINIIYASKGTPATFHEPADHAELEYELVWIHPDAEERALKWLEDNNDEMCDYLFKQLEEDHADQKAEAAYDAYLDRKGW